MDTDTRLALAEEKIRNLEKRLDAAEEKFVTSKHFEALIGPIRSLLYGLVTLILSGFVGGLWTVLKSGQ